MSNNFQENHSKIIEFQFLGTRSALTKFNRIKISVTNYVEWIRSNLKFDVLSEVKKTKQEQTLFKRSVAGFGGVLII